MSEQYKTLMDQQASQMEMEAVKALDSTTGAPLNPEVKSDIITNLVKVKTPLLGLISDEVYSGDEYKFIRKTALASESSGITGENAVVVEDDGFTSTEVPLTAREIKRISGVTLREMEEDGTKGKKSFGEEVVSKATAIGNEIDLSTIWGEGTADQYQMNGIFSQLDSTSITALSGTLTERILDDTLASVLESETDQTFAWLCSPQMLYGISRLQKNRVNFNRENATIILPGGYVFNSYGVMHGKMIPIIPSTFMKVPGTMSTPTPSLVAGGTLADATTYYYRVAAIVSRPEGVGGYAKGGETVASVEVSQLTATPNLSVKLTWTAYPGAISYVIFRSTTSGAETRLATIAARTYDANGTVTGNVIDYTDNGSLTPDGYYKPLDTDEETMILLPLQKKSIHWIRLNSDANMNKLITYTDLAADDKYSKRFRMHTFLNLALRDTIITKAIRNVELPA